MITIYHLSTSRSERIIWLMEELGEPYELVKFRRGENMRSPPALREIHPLAKSPTIRDGDLLLIESGAIMEYIVEKYGRLAPEPRTPARARYLQWMHFCEGSLLPVVIQTLRGMGVFGGEALPDVDALKANSDRYFHFIEGELGGEPYFAGKDFTAADVMMMYGLRWLDRLTDAEQLPNLKAYRARIAERPAYQKAMAIANPPA